LEAEVAKEELGVKRVCPETGKKFYDLNKDPIVSPYTGKSYPRSFFEEAVAPKPVRKEAAPTVATPTEAAEPEEEVAGAPEFVSLEEAEGDADAEEAAEGEEIPDIPDVEVEDDGAEDETFLAEDEEEDENLSGVFEGGKDPEEP
jgi:uncharacterized protein (TIGR02300 family)